ncbi:MAG: class I SAM-dependent methyltransferase [Candidatus Peribacteraceae bacterium]|nr:class I SAM-dependent methyltransferase [Candidatus Peribacteraceae bacterium]
MEQKQVDKDAYDFRRYAAGGRFVSYQRQLGCLLDRKPASVLEVGVGDGLVGDYLRRNTAVQYRSLDVAEDLHPDIIGSVTAIPLPDRDVDIACAFEVLEHLPFESFPAALKELARIARTHVIISLPHYGPAFKCSLKLPLLPELKVAFKIPHAPAHTFDGQHYWEIGKQGYPPSRIRAALKEIGEIEEEFIPFESQYHHFFAVVLK